MDDKALVFAKIYYSTLEPLITSLRVSSPRFVRSLNLEVKNILFPTVRRCQITTCSRQVTIDVPLPAPLRTSKQQCLIYLSEKPQNRWFKLLFSQQVSLSGKLFLCLGLILKRPVMKGPTVQNFNGA